MLCRAESTGQAKDAWSNPSAAVGFPNTTVACRTRTVAALGGPGGASRVWAVQCMRSDLSGPPQLAWLSCFSPPARLSTGAHQNPSSRDSESHPGINNPPAAVRNIATSLSSRSGFSSLEWIYRLAVSQERVTFPDLSFWDTSSSQSVPCTDLQRATVDTRRPNAATPCCTSSILGRSSTTPEGRSDL